jgi:hypothetical protein
LNLPIEFYRDFIDPGRVKRAENTRRVVVLEVDAAGVSVDGYSERDVQHGGGVAAGDVASHDRIAYEVQGPIERFAAEAEQRTLIDAGHGNQSGRTDPFIDRGPNGGPGGAADNKVDGNGTIEQWDLLVEPRPSLLVSVVTVVCDAPGRVIRLGAAASRGWFTVRVPSQHDLLQSSTSIGSRSR